MATSSETASSDEQISIHGDVLVAVLSRAPLIHLLSASLVSKSWNAAVFTALRTSNKPQPWLIVHTQQSRSPYPTTTHAFDPASNMWIEIVQPSIDYVSVIRSSQSNLLYMLSPTKLSFSNDPLHVTWYHAAAPRVWRIDPVVAVVGERVVVAGGACDFESDPCAVEVYDVRSKEWTKSEPMPEILNESATSMWLSVASDNRQLFIMDKNSGVAHSFNPKANKWSEPHDLRPDHHVFYSVIGFSNEKLIMIGMLGDAEDVDCVKLWEVNCESFQCNEIGAMPANLVEKLRGEEDSGISSIDVCMAGNLAYIYIPLRPEEVVVCEFIDGGGCRWRSATNAAASDRSIIERFVFTCSNVGIEDLQRATRSENRRFVVKQ